MLNRLIWFVVLCGAGMLTVGNLVLLMVAVLVVAPTLFGNGTQRWPDCAGLAKWYSIPWSEYFVWPLVLHLRWRHESKISRSVNLFKGT